MGSFWKCALRDHLDLQMGIGGLGAPTSPADEKGQENGKWGCKLSKNAAAAATARDSIEVH